MKTASRESLNGSVMPTVPLIRSIIGEAFHGKLKSVVTDLDKELTLERLADWRQDGGNGPVGRDAWRFLGDRGAIGLSIPVEYGGGGFGFPGSLALTLCLAARDEGGFVLGANVQSEVACRWLLPADPAVRETFLPRLLSGESVACQCDTDPSEKEPTIVEEDGDSLVVTGRKLYVVNGAQSDICFVAGRLGVSPVIVLVEKGRPGVSVEKVWDKLGTRSIDSATVVFDNVRVPRSHLLSRHGLAQMIRWNEVMSCLRLSIAAAAMTIHASVLDHIIAHTTKRPFGGRTLAGWPVNHHALTKAGGDLALMKVGIAQCLSMVGKSPEAVSKVAQVKWFCVERACDLARLACDLEGGMGYMAESRSLAAYRTLRGFRMAGGSQTTMLTVTNHSLANKAETAPHAIEQPRLDLVQS